MTTPFATEARAFHTQPTPIEAGLRARQQHQPHIPKSRWPLPFLLQGLVLRWPPENLRARSCYTSAQLHPSRARRSQAPRPTHSAHSLRKEQPTRARLRFQPPNKPFRCISYKCPIPKARPEPRLAPPRGGARPPAGRANAGFPGRLSTVFTSLFSGRKACLTRGTNPKARICPSFDPCRSLRLPPKPAPTSRSRSRSQPCSGELPTFHRSGPRTTNAT